MEVPEPAVGARLDAGRLAAGRLAQGLPVLRRAPGGAVSEHADLSELARGHLNDMVVDAHGRAYVGNFGFDLMAGADPSPTT